MSASTTSNSTSDLSTQLDHFSSTATTSRRMDKASISAKKSELIFYALSTQYLTNGYLSEAISSLFSSDSEDEPQVESELIVHATSTSKFSPNLNYFISYINPLLIELDFSRGCLIYQYD